MNGLHDLQDKFQSYLLHDQISAEAAIQESVVHTEKVPATTRLAIYKEAYQARLVDALASNYPCISAYLGLEEFQQLSFSYMNNHPSTYRSIRWFGDKLVDYLIQNPKEQYPFLAELAEFEWKMTLSFDAMDSDAFKIEQMAGIPAEQWGNMQFIPHPSLQSMHFFWNVVALWQSITNKKEPESLVKNSSPTSWILWRSDYVNRFCPLSEEESWAVNAMMNGITFGELCEGLCQWNEEDQVGMRAASLLKGWIQSGLVNSITV